MSETTRSVTIGANPGSTITSQRHRSAFRTLLLGKLAKITHGGITLLEAGEKHFFGDADAELQATIWVHDTTFYRTATLGGSLGVAEAYLERAWDCDDLTTLFRIFLQNGRTRSGIEKSLSSLQGAVERMADYFNRNTLTGSKRNIRAHYDLSNEFFQLWLDETMTYSSGIFLSERATMAEASTEKLDRICRKLNLQPDDHVLEIGTGWGSFALHAAGNYGCRVTTTTISDQQYSLAVQRIRDAGLEDRVTVLKQDYRALTGSYDKIVSIEMIEAVGHQFIPAYVSKLNQLVKSGGTVAIQAITISDRHYDRYRKSVDFIKKYIFPGGNLVSLNYLFETVAQRSSLRVTGLEEIGLHYADTLRRWRHRFEAVLPEVRELGFPEHFIRMWRYYLTYCEAGFMEKHIGTVQLTFEKA